MDFSRQGSDQGTSSRIIVDVSASSRYVHIVQEGRDGWVMTTASAAETAVKDG